MFNFILADLVAFIHKILSLYIFIGFIITPIQYLKYYMFLILLIFLGWSVFGNCILTGLEHGFRTGEWKPVTAGKEGAPEFFRPLMKKIFNLKLTREESVRLNQGLFTLFLLIAFIRLLKNSILKV
jgi:hypothetical protein